MNVLIVGAGASRATHLLPIARKALQVWEPNTREHHRLLAFALEKWEGSGWREVDLEEAWKGIDVAWKDRVAEE